MHPATTEVERLPAKGEVPGEGVRLTFEQEGPLEGELRLLLSKAVTVFAGEDSLLVEYRLQNRSRGSASFHFGIEFNLAFLSGSDDERYYEIPGRELQERQLGSRGVEEAVKEVLLIDGRRKIRLALSWSRPALLWRTPVETISSSEAGLERSYQQSLLLPRWQIELGAGESERISLQLQLSAAPEREPQRAMAGTEARS